MYDILTLNDKKVAELKEVAQEFNIEKIDKFKNAQAMTLKNVQKCMTLQVIHYCNF